MTDAHIAEPLRRLSVPIADLTPDPANARKHGQRNLDAIKASLAAFGQRKPLVVQRQGMIVRAGNGTMQAAKALGWEHIAAVVIDEDSAQAVQFAIADNRTAELAEWDDETLASLLDGMDETTRDMLAFDDKELAGLMRGLEPDEIVEDEAPEPPADPITQTGDLWTLGQHRLLCGDSTDAQQVQRLMDGKRAVLMLSDPPYNVGYEYSDHGDDLSDADYQEFCDAYMRHGTEVSQMQVITPGKSNERRYEPSEYMTWFKGFGLSRGSFYKAMVTEPILLFGNKPTGRFYATDHFHIGTEREPGLRKKHTCPKPVKLFAELMQPMTDKGDIVYEAFCGSGTTLIASEQLGRTCYGMEISPAYCDVIVERWQNLTGQKAVRNG